MSIPRSRHISIGYVVFRPIVRCCDVSAMLLNNILNLTLTYHSLFLSKIVKGTRMHFPLEYLAHLSDSAVSQGVYRCNTTALSSLDLCQGFLLMLLLFPSLSLFLFLLSPQGRQVVRKRHLSTNIPFAINQKPTTLLIQHNNKIKIDLQEMEL